MEQNMRFFYVFMGKIFFVTQIRLNQLRLALLETPPCPTSIKFRVNVLTVRKIAQIFVALSEKLNFIMTNVMMCKMVKYFLH